MRRLRVHGAWLSTDQIECPSIITHFAFGVAQVRIGFRVRNPMGLKGGIMLTDGAIPSTLNSNNAF